MSPTIWRKIPAVLCIIGKPLWDHPVQDNSASLSSSIFPFSFFFSMPAWPDRLNSRQRRVSVMREQLRQRAVRLPRPNRWTPQRRIYADGIPPTLPPYSFLYLYVSVVRLPCIKLLSECVTFPPNFWMQCLFMTSLPADFWMREMDRWGVKETSTAAS